MNVKGRQSEGKQWEGGRKRERESQEQVKGMNGNIQHLCN
jgi:hypothetical protein